MAHARISTITWSAEVGRDHICTTQEELVPFVRGLPGFISFSSILTNPHVTVSTSTWQTAREADAGRDRITAWLRDHPLRKPMSIDTVDGEVIAST